MNELKTFIEGFASFVSPCVLPLLPIYFIYFSGGEANKKRTLMNTIAFSLGFTLVFVLLGVFAGSLGAMLSAHRSVVQYVCGGIIILFGIAFLLGLKLPVGMKMGAIKVTGVVSAFLFGMVFTLFLTPCAGPFLGAALMTAAAEQSVLTGARLLTFYALGLAVPLILSALLIDQLKGMLATVRSHARLINTFCGALLILFGAHMIYSEIQLVQRVESAEAEPVVTETAPAPVPTQVAPAPAPAPVVEAMDMTFAGEVLSAKGYVLVDFWAPWCGPCRRMAPILESIAASEAGNLKVVKVNIDDSPVTPDRYGVQSIPTFILFKDGQIVGKAIGSMPQEELLRQLKYTK